MNIFRPIILGWRFLTDRRSVEVLSVRVRQR
uniref:Uncharacterized protein n=1 Tax=Rhizophora mucronata TaxID=61149 RepID=A0A2P2QSK7_RHIMU